MDGTGLFKTLTKEDGIAVLFLLCKSIANLAMCRFLRHGHKIKSAWAGTAHMRKNFMRPRRMKFYPWPLQRSMTLCSSHFPLR